jgi:hypothetical protein
VFHEERRHNRSRSRRHGNLIYWRTRERLRDAPIQLTTGRKLEKTLDIVCFVFIACERFGLGHNLYHGFPPPGGVTFTQSGPGSGAANGQTYSFTGFNSSQYHTLYWGLNSVVN